MPKSESIQITAVWLRRIGDHAEVLVETMGEWRIVAREPIDSPFSHIAGVRGVNHWPIDPVTE